MARLSRPTEPLSSGERGALDALKGRQSLQPPRYILAHEGRELLNGSDLILYGGSSLPLRALRRQALKRLSRLSSPSEVQRKHRVLLASDAAFADALLLNSAGAIRWAELVDADLERLGLKDARHRWTGERAALALYSGDYAAARKLALDFRKQAKEGFFTHSTASRVLNTLEFLERGVIPKVDDGARFVPLPLAHLEERYFKTNKGKHYDIAPYRSSKFWAFVALYAPRLKRQLPELRALIEEDQMGGASVDAFLEWPLRLASAALAARRIGAVKAADHLSGRVARLRDLLDRPDLGMVLWVLTAR
jgi:hypothetical protein